MQKSKLILAVFSFILLWTGISYAYLPEPKSQGKFFENKGTQASQEYESQAGMPTYDYGNGFQIGPVHLKPDFEFDERWDDNVFYTEDSRKSDMVSALRGTFLAELPLSGGQHLLSASYGFLHEWFGRFDNQNHTDHRGMVGLNLNFVPFTLDIEDTYERTESRADTEFTDRILRDENAFHSLLEVPFASFFLENEITDFDVTYNRSVDAVFDHNLFTVYQRVGYDMSPNTQLLAEYAFINVDYDQTTFGERDGEGNQFMLGMRGKLTERVAYQIWGGAQYRIYDDDTRPDFNGFVARGALQWDMSETDRFIVRGDRQPQESTFDNQSYYTRNRAELTWRKQVAERWYLNTTGMYDYHEYSRITTTGPDNTTRRDAMWTAGTGLEYHMPNDIVSLTLDYRFVGRDSNLAGLDYYGNEVSAGVRASF